MMDASIQSKRYEQLIPVKSFTRSIMSGVSFSQESVFVEHKRFSNFYWIEINPDKYKFQLSVNKTPTPLLRHECMGKRNFAGINFGSFFLSDDMFNVHVPFYNLVVDKGTLMQFPSNSRPALFTRHGHISQRIVPANGMIRIGTHTFSWSGSGLSDNKDSDLTAWGMFDITIERKKYKKALPRRRIIRDTDIVSCRASQISLGFSIKKGTPVLITITSAPLELSKYCFILQGDNPEMTRLRKGMVINEIELGSTEVRDDDTICSASFSLGTTRDQLVENLKTQLVYSPRSSPKPLEENYHKAWSVVIRTKDSVVFLISDARPGCEKTDGLTVFELQRTLLEHFEWQWALVGDSGQSCKLVLADGNEKDVYGNLHYVDYKNKSWDGRNGRAIPVSLLAYE